MNICFRGYAEGFSYGMGIDSRQGPIPQDILNKAEAIYERLKSTSTHPMKKRKATDLRINGWRKVYCMLHKKALYCMGWKKRKVNVNVNSFSI